MDINVVAIGGRLTRDPETRAVGDTSVTDIGLACNRRFTKKDGEKVEETTFVDVTLWGKTGEIAQQYLKKGSLAFVRGRLTLDSWEAKETGEKRSKLKVTGEELVLGPKNEAVAGGGNPSGGGNGGNNDGEASGGPLF